jgi:hypothetical protein
VKDEKEFLAILGEIKEYLHDIAEELKKLNY